MKRNRTVLLASTVLILAVGLLAACCAESMQNPGETQLTLLPTVVFEEEASPQETHAPAKTSAPTEPPADESTEAPQPTEAPALPDGETLLQARCTVCHGLERTTRASKTHEEWTVTLDRMIDKGAELSADERDVLIDYLAEVYGAE
ncbi:MAG: hypothetical protein AB8I69_11865 [Anaerolineae bacterium]|jgi:cytochrome c5